MVCQCVPNTSTSPQSASTPWTILQPSPVVLSSSYLRLCTLAQSFGWPVHNIFRRIFFRHDLPYHMTTRLLLREVSHTQEISQMRQQKFRDSNIFCIPQKYFRSVRIHVEYIPNRCGQKKDVGSPRSTSVINFFHIGLVFLLPSSRYDVVHVYR